MRYRLRDYQERAIEGARELLRQGRRAPIIWASTGAGKTVIASAIIEQSAARRSRVLFLAHRKELIEQASAKLDEIGVMHGIIKADNPRVDPSARVQVASVQTLRSRLDRLTQGYDLIIIDECHHATAGSYEAIIKANPAAIRLGLSATPYRADGKGLGDVFDSIVEVASMEWLIERGYLVRSRVMVGRRISLEGVHTVGADYNLGELAERVNQPKIVGDIVGSWKRYAGDRLTVAFTVSVEHSRTMAQAFRDAGIEAFHVDGEMPEDERGRTLRAFSAHFAPGLSPGRVLCNCAVLTEGWDCPAASAIILARPTKSRGLWRQMVGRTLRPAEGKVDCLVLDHSNCTDTHGFVTDPDRVDLKSGISLQRPVATRRCRSCGAEFAGRPPYCPKCGAELVSAGGERLDEKLMLGSREFEMVEVTRRRAQKPKSQQDAGRNFRFLYYKDIRDAYARGYSPGWAVARHKARTGQWPTPDLDNFAPHKTKVALDPVTGKQRRLWVVPPPIVREETA